MATRPEPAVATAPIVEDDEPIRMVGTDLALRNPQVPATLDDLAALRGAAVEVVLARAAVLETARKQMLRATQPSDWNYYRATEGQVTCYLSDAGCQRIRDFLGVSIYNVAKPEKVMVDGQHFVYVQSAWGKSNLTGQIVEEVEGGRGSQEDFCKDERESGNLAQLELKVRKACRANVNGNIARELCGLKNVPLEELQAAWQGTTKDWNQGHKAKGFGSQAERLGATRAGVPDVPPPTCSVCKDPKGAPLPLVFRQGKDGKPSFYGCRNWDKHKSVKAIVDAADWEKTQQKAQRDVQADAQAQAKEREETTRQPGEDG